MADNRLDKLNPQTGAPTKPVKLQNIHLANFGFFYGEDEDENTLHFNGKNVLLYGENGSGKTTITRALGLLIKNSISESEFLELKNIYARDADNEYVHYRFLNAKNDEREVSISKDQLTEYSGLKHLKEVFVFQPILTYKDLLKVHFTTAKGTDPVNIYPMLRNIFSNYSTEEGKVLKDEKNPDEYFKLLNDIVNKEVLGLAQDILKQFDKTFKLDRIDFRREFAGDDSSSLVFVANLQIEIDKDHEVDLPHYHLFLNEARLTALAISLYFASILQMAKQSGSESMKFLVLDDLLISLDMSNRLLLLEVIFKHFSDFQIFFFTHDKHLFQLYAKRLTNWQKIELYTGDVDGNPRPVIMPHKGYLERAKAYFKKNDYAACGNILRKACEELLKEKLPVSYLVASDKHTFFSQLNDLQRQLRKYYTDCWLEIPTDIDIRLTLFSDAVLNPSSHDDIESPLYRKEIEEAFELVEELQKLELPERKQLLKKGDILIYENTAKKYIAEVELLQPVFFVPKLSSIECAKIKCFIKAFKHDQKTGSDINERSLKEAYQGILKHLSIENDDDCLDVFKLKSQSLRDLLQ